MGRSNCTCTLYIYRELSAKRLRELTSIPNDKDYVCLFLTEIANNNIKQNHINLEIRQKNIRPST